MTYQFLYKEQIDQNLCKRELINLLVPMMATLDK